MNLKHKKFAASAARPFYSKVITLEMLRIWDVNGALIDVSVSEKSSPESACLSALQSLAPSPTIPTVRFKLK